jgi:hypothetical protein
MTGEGGRKGEEEEEEGKSRGGEVLVSNLASYWIRLDGHCTYHRPMRWLEMS